jgi:hypothetical protein
MCTLFEYWFLKFQMIFWRRILSQGKYYHLILQVRRKLVIILNQSKKRLVIILSLSKKWKQRNLPRSSLLLLMLLIKE